MTQYRNNRMSTEDNELAYLQHKEAQRLLDVYSEENFMRGWQHSFEDTVRRFFAEEASQHVATFIDLQMTLDLPAHPESLVTVVAWDALERINQVTANELAEANAGDHDLQELAREELIIAFTMLTSDMTLSAAARSMVELALSRLTESAADQAVA